MVGTCIFALAVVREDEGSSVSIAEMACPTAIFCEVVLFISWIKYSS